MLFFISYIGVEYTLAFAFLEASSSFGSNPYGVGLPALSTIAPGRTPRGNGGATAPVYSGWNGVDETRALASVEIEIGCVIGFLIGLVRGGEGEAALGAEVSRLLDLRLTAGAISRGVLDLCI